MNYISITGYGWSGSSAYLSLLKEFDGFGCIDKEFRLVKDPFGLLDLQTSLVDNWEFVRHDVAIRDYLWFCHILARGDSLFGAFGSDYDKLLSINFVQESIDYINRLTDFSYIGDSVVHKYRLNRIHYSYKKIISKLGYYNNSGIMRFARPSEEKFINETRSFLNSIFENYKIKNNIRNIVLDQGISVSNIEKSSKYFDSVKTIIVDRDPRDIYVSLVKRKKLLGFELSNRNSVMKYIYWHKILRRNIESNSINNNVLNVSFEDLTLNYKPTVKKVINFIDNKPMEHAFPGKYFNKDKAIKNVGLWVNYPDQSAMDLIYNELREDCIKYE